MKGKVLKPPLSSEVLNNGSSMPPSSSAADGPSITEAERKWRLKQLESKKFDEQLVPRNQRKKQGEIH